MRSLETVDVSEIVVKIAPELPDDWIVEESVNELPIVVIEDLTEDKEALGAKGPVELWASRLELLIFPL
jgi:hypothetical protein